jgi:hypothetical protein
MAKPYSIDLRERAVSAVLKGGLSRALFGNGTKAIGVPHCGSHYSKARRD